MNFQYNASTTLTKQCKIHIFQLGCQNADEVILQAINLYGNEREKPEHVGHVYNGRTDGKKGKRGGKEVGKGQEAAAAAGWKEGRKDRPGVEAAQEKIRK